MEKLLCIIMGDLQVLSAISNNNIWSSALLEFLLEILMPLKMYSVT